MNERIKELLSQSGMLKILDEHASEYGNGFYQAEHYPELEKFAELIIKKCIEHARTTPELTIGQGYCVTLHLRKHFGVENNGCI